MSGQRERYGRLEVAASKPDDHLPDGLYGVEVVYVREDVLVPLRAGEFLLELAPVEHVGRDELRVSDDRRAELQRQQPGDVEVVDPEERHVVRDAVHRHRHVGRHEERAARAVGRVRFIGPLLLAHLPLSVAHHLHRVPDEAEEEASRRSCRGALAIHSTEVAQQVESVDEDVVVGLEHVARVRAVARDPAQRRDALVCQVAIRVVKVLRTYTRQLINWHRIRLISVLLSNLAAGRMAESPTHCCSSGTEG